MAASKEAYDFVSRVAKSLEIGLKTQGAAGTVAGSYMQDKGRSDQAKLLGSGIEFVAAQLDVAAELVEMAAKQGKGIKVTKAALASALAKKGLSFFELAPQDSLQCAGALVSLGLSLGTMVASLPTGVGWIPAGAVLLTDFYATYVDCKNPFKEGVQDAENSFTAFFARLEYEIYRLYFPSYPNVP